ncbi:MAG: hypothetical protein LBM99_04110, partial [Bacillales bacterium]|nr:hypothetical protein [Bacillales bacterium]
MATTPKKNNFLKTWLPYILVVGVLIFIITYFGAQSGRGTALAPTAPQLISKIEQYAESTDKTCIATQDTDTGNFCKVEKFVINAENTGSQTIFTGSWQEKEVKVGGKTEKYTFTLTLSAGDDAVSDIFYALNVNGVPYKSINPNENGIWLSLLVNLLPTVLLIVGA